MFISKKHTQILRFIPFASLMLTIGHSINMYFFEKGYFLFIIDEPQNISYVWFVILRVIVCCTAILSFFELRNNTIIFKKSIVKLTNYTDSYYYKNDILKVIYLLIAIVFNPIFQFHFGLTIWLIIDVCVASTFFYHLVSIKNWNKKRKEESKELRKLYSEFKDLSNYKKE